jgi:hypothetical protein
MNHMKQPLFALGLFVLSLLPIFVDGQIRIRTGADRVLGEITPEPERRYLVETLIEDVSRRVKVWRWKILPFDKLAHCDAIPSRWNMQIFRFRCLFQ